MRSRFPLCASLNRGPPASSGSSGSIRTASTHYRGPIGGGTFLGRLSRRTFASVTVIGSVGWLGACGQSEEPTSIAAVQKCLRDQGLDVLGPAKPGPDDDDAPDRGELITTGAFVAFYSSSDRAEELAAGVRKNAEQARGEVARYDDVTVVYLPNAKRDTIESCVEP
jgi:hypothetical protein